MMNHHLERDRRALRFALSSDAPYIGVLGPRSRYLKLLDALERDGYVPPAAASQRSAARSAWPWARKRRKRVAVSILGEILAVEARVRRRLPQRRDRQPSRSGRERLDGALVVVGRIDVHQQLRQGIAARRSGPRGGGAPAGRRARARASSGKNSRSNRCGGAMTSP